MKDWMEHIKNYPENKSGFICDWVNSKKGAKGDDFR